MFPAIWRRLVGREFATQRAVLAGFAVYRVRDGAYPVMVAATPQDRVAGLVYFDVDETTLHTLDAYESALYDRVAVEVILENGQALMCEAYVLPAERRHLASDEGWNEEAFAREELAGYLARLSER